MSKFFEALEQAERDRATQGSAAAPIRVPVPPAPLDPVAVPDGDVPEGSELLEDHLVSLLDPTSFAAEQYRALGHLLEQVQRAAGPSIIGISSPAVGDGKTLTATNLAGSLSQASRSRVLLVDMDLRRSSIARSLGLRDAGPGLIRTILDEGLTLADAAVPCPPFHLSVVPAGRRHANVTSEVLKSPRVGHLLEEARRRFDYVILDLPPLVPIPDCRIVERWVDGFLVVVAAGRTPRRLVEEALAVLDPQKILGLVFNADDRPLSEYAYEYVAAKNPDGRRSFLGDFGRWRR
jgi:capsular exopolysaccharide synthesis family protein